MPLTDEQRQAIRDEEYFRNEVRKELAGKSGSPGFLARCSAFFETKAGFWLLTTVLAGVTATGFSSLQRYIDHEEIAQREGAERARRDMETVLKLGPMLTSDKRTQVDVAIVLLDGLASDKALDTRIANQVKALFQNTLEAGNKRDASVEEKAQRDAIIAFADRPRVEAIQRADKDVPATTSMTQSSLSAAIDSSALPVRVYLQIGNEGDRPSAEAASESLRKAGLIVPGIELVPVKSAPKQNDLRYCDGKVEADVLDRVKSAVAAAVMPTPQIVVLSPSLCGKVRFNHFEVWYARRGG
jgi:hypothetical protein